MGNKLSISEAREAEEIRRREREEEAAALADLARAHEPANGWGTRSTINDAWADGFRTACVEISDAILRLKTPAYKDL